MDFVPVDIVSVGFSSGGDLPQTTEATREFEFSRVLRLRWVNTRSGFGAFDLRHRYVSRFLKIKPPSLQARHGRTDLSCVFGLVR